MRKNIVSICVLALLLVTFSVFGQEDRNKGIINSALIGLEYEVKAGFNIGGTAPMPLPVEIRDITGYNPTMAVAIEGNVTKWFDQEKKWGMRIGIRLDSKGMKTNAKVKNYGMEITGRIAFAQITIIHVSGKITTNIYAKYGPRFILKRRLN